MDIRATRELSNLTIEPTSGSGRLTARPVMKRPTPPVIAHWDEVINMSQSAPDIFFLLISQSYSLSSISPSSQCSQSVAPRGAADAQSR